MPGYNHYDDCECGWCVNYGRSSLQARMLDGLRQRDALTLLKRHGAKSIAGCFINPNARCPVCSEPVFFYANQFGSRVYFDDLGPPWPKHPCTDNPRRRIEHRAEIDCASTRRARGETQELITASNTVGHFRNKVLGNRNPREWTLLVTVSIERQDQKNFVKAEFLDSLDHELMSFKCISAEPIFEVGGFISKKGNEISLLCKKTLTPIVFVIGGIVPSPQNKIAPATLTPQRPIETIKIPAPTATQKPRDGGKKSEITELEMKHFQSWKVTRKMFCDNLAPVVRSLAKEGTRKPRDVALRLNYQGHKTACGDKWTKRLVYVLLGFIFNDKGSSDRPRGQTQAIEDGARSKATGRNGREADQSKTLSLRQPLTDEEGDQPSHT